jgi:hypothetical protein
MFLGLEKNIRHPSGFGMADYSLVEPEMIIFF